MSKSAKPLKETFMPINDHNWYWEEKKGILLIHKIPGGTDQILIPWKRLLESVRRKYGRVV